MEEYVLYGGPLEIPKESLGQFIYHCLKKHKNKIAQIDAITNRTLTFNDILQSSSVLAHNLIVKGYKPGDIVTVISENKLEFVIPAIATLFIGVIFSPINPSYTPDEVLHDTNITKPKCIFCTKRSLPTVCAAMKKGLRVEEIIILDNSISFEFIDMITCNCTLLSDLLKPLNSAFTAEKFLPFDIDPKLQTTVMLRSSGTTGFPKGVLLSGLNMLTYITCARYPESFGFEASDILLGLVPFFHGYGYGVMMCALVLGYQIVVLPKFEESLFLSTIQKYKITCLLLVPPLIVFLAKHPLVDKYNLSSVRLVFSGAAPASDGIIEKVKNRLGFLIRQGYGMTELSIVTNVIPPNVYKPKSIGILFRGIYAKVVDLETGKALGPNVSGELCFRGPCIMQGYFNNDEATREIIDKDGWLHTGDVGYYDEDKYFYIVDRIKELIKYKGYQVAPAVVEAVILSHPEVKDAAVLGIPDEVAGELPKAYVVAQPGATINELDLVYFVADKVSGHMRLRGGVEFVTEIPKTASGKILRRVLRNKSKL